MAKNDKKLKLKRSWGELKVETFNFSLIESYFRNNDNSMFFQEISDKTANDIDFPELFVFVDRTHSKIGQQYLYNKLRIIDLNSNFTEQENLIEYYLKNEDKRLRSQLLLSKLDKHESYFLASLFQDKYVDRPQWFWIIPTLSVFSILSLVLAFIIPKFFLVYVLILAVNLMLHYWNKKNIYLYTDSIPQLLRLFQVTRNLLKIHPEESVMKSLDTLSAYKRSMGLFSLESKMDSDFAIFFWLLMEYLKISFLIEPIVVFRVLKKLDRKRDEIHTLFKYVGRIDSAISLGSLRVSLKAYCNPEFLSEDRSLRFEEIYHPLISDCITNSLVIDRKSILLTGSNMSGKTTFIRTVGINALCAQTINTCFAKQFALKPMRIYSAIRISDDLMNDKSYYFEEVLTIKQMIIESQSSSCNLFLLDEIFKGTNTIERIAAGKAVLSYIAKNNNLVFVSTHDVELTDMLRDSYELYHFTEMVENNSIYFDYKLKEGNLSTRNAIKILELNAYPAEITSEAKDISRSISGFN
jgi:Mismatch repair ATPase (MutS family)